jgi:hypothetical protein
MILLSVVSGVFWTVAFVIQHVQRMRRVIFSSVFSLAPPCFSTLSDTGSLHSDYLSRLTPESSLMCVSAQVQTGHYKQLQFGVWVCQLLCRPLVAFLCRNQRRWIYMEMLDAFLNYIGCFVLEALLPIKVIIWKRRVS